MLLLAAAGALIATTMSGGGVAPPVQPEAARPEIGAPAPADRLHVISRPGLYGVAHPAAGMQYAVVGDSLVRIDADTKVVRAIIRGGVHPID